MNGASFSESSSVQGPQGFRRLGLRSAYNTSRHNLANEFFIPLLSNAISYDRGVGYFSSGWLRVNAEGLAALAVRGGRSRWVTSPQLSQADIELFSRIARLEESPRHISDLLNTVKALQNALERDTLNTMAWMVADGLLEFRFAIPTGELMGDFHDKFGVFRDEYGQRVSFLGSYNETVQGLRNYESIRVFKSWEPGYVEVVDEDEQRFTRIWLGREQNLRTFELPDAVREGILALRSDDRPYPKPKSVFGAATSIRLSGILPREYQNEAIKAWDENGRRGILDMATGTGKTVTALSALTRCPEVGYVIIGAPTKALVSQWLEALQKIEGIHPPIEISSNNPTWSEGVLPRLRLATASQSRSRPFVFVGTYASLAGERFLSIIEKLPQLPETGLLIADEVHNLGARTHQRLLRPQFDYRLGLTATLERSHDPEGTEAIDNYFEGVVYQLGIEKIVGSILCQYRYDVYFVALDEDEFAEYQKLSRQIAGSMGKTSKGKAGELVDGQSERLTLLLNRRANIIKLARAKLEFLRDLVRQIDLNKCLLYCADLEQLQVVQEILAEAGILHLPYTSQQSDFARQMALEQLRRNDIRAVPAVKCLDEGIDVPQVHQAILLASSTSEREFVQRRGRILRKTAGKDFAHLIDIFTLPPRRHFENPPALLFNELRRAMILARAADNRYEAEVRLIEELENFGIPIEQTLGA